MIKLPPKIQGLLSAAALIGIILLSLWWIGEGVSAVSDSAAKQALNLEGRRLLYQMRLRLNVNKEETGTFEGDVGSSPMKTSFFGAGTKDFWWGLPEYQKQVAQFCPDCGLEKDRFKIVTIGNIDQDAELDVWIQTQDEAEARQINSD